MQRERDGETTNAQGCDEWRDVDAEVLQDDEDAEHAHGESCHVHHERGRSDRSLRTARQHLDRASRGTHARDRDRADQDDRENTHHRAHEQRIDAPNAQRQVDPRAREPDGRHASHGLDDHVVPLEARLQCDAVSALDNNAFEEEADERTANDEDSALHPGDLEEVSHVVEGRAPPRAVHRVRYQPTLRRVEDTFQ